MAHNFTSPAIWDHTVLPATRHKWTRPALIPASKLVLDLPTPEGWKAAARLAQLLHPSINILSQVAGLVLSFIAAACCTAIILSFIVSSIAWFIVAVIPHNEVNIN